MRYIWERELMFHIVTQKSGMTVKDYIIFEISPLTRQTLMFL